MIKLRSLSLLESEVTIAEVLNGEFETAHVGKWHLGLPSESPHYKPTPDKHGFDYWFATGNNASPSHHNPNNFVRNGKAVGKIEGYSCQIVVDEAIGWLDNHRKKDQPFFLNVWFHEPHAPIAAPDSISNLYEGEKRLKYIQVQLITQIVQLPDFLINLKRLRLKKIH